jgi:hypothetical protein
MLPTDLLKAGFTFFVMAPVAASILAFKGPPLARQISRIVLFSAWLAHAAATFALLRYAFAKPSSGIGNQILVVVAVPTAVFAFVWFGLWRAARRHDYVQSLPLPERRIEELEDIDRGLEAARKSLRDSERRLERWGIGPEERARVRFEIGTLRVTIDRLEQERAKRA